VSDTRTPEQREADDALDAAIRRVIELGDDYSGELLTDWAVVYCCLHSTEDDRHAYGACYPGGSLAGYRVLGLLDLAAHQIRTGSWDDD
jgi:hypothetical protein